MRLTVAMTSVSALTAILTPFLALTVTASSTLAAALNTPGVSGWRTAVLPIDPRVV